MNGCMSITRALLLYFIECNCDEFLYEYYEGIAVLYWTLTVMNGWMENMKGLLCVLYWMLNCYGMFVGVLQMI
jgi:hypothetical protein